jgi:hypothetical protein
MRSSQGASQVVGVAVSCLANGYLYYQLTTVLPEKKERAHATA